MEMPENELPADAAACPECGVEALPEYVDQDVDIRINWQELYILCTWAVNWESEVGLDHNGSIIAAIIKQLEKYQPNGGVPLPKWANTDEDARVH